MAHTEAEQTGKKSQKQKNSPWDMEWMAQASHSDLYNLREKAETKEEQNLIAPFEHRAYAREAIQESPIPIAAAIGITAGIPGYQAKKVLGMTNSRSDPSIEQMVEGFKGVAEGVASVVAEPWKQAWDYVSEKTQAIKEAITPQESPKEDATAPWLKDWRHTPKKQKQTPVEAPKPSPKWTELTKLPQEELKKVAYNDPRLDSYANEVESKYGLPSGLIEAVKNAGEKSNSHQVSPKGAKGVMQFTDGTRKAYEHDYTNPLDSIDAAGRYFKDLLSQYGGNVKAAIAHYNGGTKAAKAVLKDDEIPYEETRNYWSRIETYMNKKQKVARN